MDSVRRKRHAGEALDDVVGVDSPASKKSRIGDASPAQNGNAEDTPANGDVEETARQRADADADADADEEEDEDEAAAAAAAAAPIRQSAPTSGYDDLYLDTIDRNVLDFDFEKLCSISLSNINVYACLVCGKYFQGRGPKSHAYFHSLEGDHHVYINMQTQKVYVLPEGYEVKSKSLDDIKYVSDPRYTRHEVASLDRAPPRIAWTLEGRDYARGYVGMNNLKENDYLNVVVQALSHVAPLRNFFLLEDFSASRSELVRRTAILFRKIWNPRAFKAHVSPHELLQQVALESNKRFTLTHQSDPVDFLSWFLNNLHLGLGGSKTRPGSSMVQRVFQGKLKVESQDITATTAAAGGDSDTAMTGGGAGGDRLRFEESSQVNVMTTRFLLLTLDLPPAPLFQDENNRNIIPQVPLASLLSKYDGHRAQEHLSQRKRYRLLHPLPPFLAFHVKRFGRNKFTDERNPTIVTFDARAPLDVSPYVEPEAGSESNNNNTNNENGASSEPIWYDLVANVVHEAVRARREDVADAVGEERKTWKVQLRDRARGHDTWVSCQDLFVDKVQSELLYLGETYLQIWERRRGPKGGRPAPASAPAPEGRNKGKGKEKDVEMEMGNAAT